MTTDDQVGVTGLLEGGAALSIHYRGGRSRGTNLLWEINGDEGDLQLTAVGGQAQIFEMTVRGGKGRAVLARGSTGARAVSVVAAARPGPFHQRRPIVRAFRPRLSRGNAFLPHVRRRGHTPSHAERDRDGRGHRSASNARLIRRGRGRFTFQDTQIVYVKPSANAARRSRKAVREACSFPSEPKPSGRPPELSRMSVLARRA